MAVNGSTTFKRFLMVVVPAVMILQFIGFVWTLWTTTKLVFDPHIFGLFFVQKLPLVLLQVTVPFLIILSFDWSTPGRTIQTILSIDEKTQTTDRRTAAFFLVGMGAIAVFASRGVY